MRILILLKYFSLQDHIPKITTKFSVNIVFRLWIQVYHNLEIRLNQTFIIQIRVIITTSNPYMEIFCKEGFGDVTITTTIKIKINIKKLKKT